MELKIFVPEEVLEAVSARRGKGGEDPQVVCGNFVQNSLRMEYVEFQKQKRAEDLVPGIVEEANTLSFEKQGEEE